MSSVRPLRTGGVAAVPEAEPRPLDFAWNRLVRGRHGWFLANLRDIYLGRALALYGEYSEGEVDLFRRVLKPGDGVLEVGANIGALTVPLARIVGESGAVFAIEPQRLAFETLCANLVLNGIMQVRPMQAAVGSEPGTVPIPVLNPWAEQNFGGFGLDTFRRDSAATVGGEPVPIMTVDSMRLGKLALVKVDVEGMERDVLVGATETLVRTRPAIYAEADREDRSPALLKFITESLGYRAWWHFPPLFNPKNFAGNERNAYGATVSQNVFAVPRERAEAAERMLPGAEVLGPEETCSEAIRRLVARRT